MSIRRMTLGEGYKYLMASVARGDGAPHPADNLTRYYAESGTPPGRFVGAGLAGLANATGIVAGSEVSEEHLFRMLGMLQDPTTGAPLGRLPITTVKYRDGAATRRPVAGFDLTFSVPKSVSVMWALADQDTKVAIHRAHVNAIRFVLSYAEQHVFFSRSGKNGVIQEDIVGIVAAAFDHWDSRAGDPQLHTHVAVLNRGQCHSDGQWRALDSKALFGAAVALSELYNGVLSDYLTAELGVGWEPVARRNSAAPKYEISGVPAPVRELFSQRSQGIDRLADDLAQRFAADHGRAPTATEMLKLRQQATLITRPPKRHHSLAELTARWRAQAARLVGPDPAAWVHSVRGINELPLQRSAGLQEAMLRELAAVAVAAVADKRATFTRSNVLAEVLRQLHGVRFTTAQDRIAVAERTVAAALDETVPITPPELTHTPARFQRADRSSRFRAVGSERYTTNQILDAEARLLDAGRATTGPAVPADVLADLTAIAHSERPVASTTQAAAVTQIATSGRLVDVLVGPAGAGKSTTMAALRKVWETGFGPGTVLGLAPSAAAAQVLTDELGITCENTAKWLTETRRNPRRRSQLAAAQARLNRSTHPIARRHHQQRTDSLTDEIDRWRLRAGQLIILDEASLAGTLTLDQISTQARAVGAKLLLVGDWAQLSAVTAGGAFHLLVHDRDQPPQLHQIHRLTEQWEKDASTRLRLGHPSAIDDYLEHDRGTDGDRGTVLDALLHAWQHDTANGARSLMIATDHATVTDLNRRARQHRIGTGEVSSDGITTAAGATIGAGDQIITRRNNRTLTTGRTWVKNGDTYTVTATNPDGSIQVRRAPGSPDIALPAEYVREHVDLGYARTAHQTQGVTVDTAHAYISATTRREHLYVMATRGRHSNQLYVDTHYDPDLDTLHGPATTATAAEILTRVLRNESGDRSATDTIRTSWTEQTHIARLIAEYDTIATADRHTRYRQLLASGGLGPNELDTLTRSPGYRELTEALDAAENHGAPIAELIPALLQREDLAGPSELAADLSRGVTRWLTHADPTPVRRERIAGLFPAASGVTNPDTQTALDDRAAAIEHRARHLAQTALQRHHPWAAQLGTPPTRPDARQTWLLQVAVIATYREQWNIHHRAILGPGPRSAEQARHRAIAANALTRALALSDGDRRDDDTRAPYRAISRDPDRALERGIDI
jgi:conjugative relaxase-like TrwC/TraI family protein